MLDMMAVPHFSAGAMENWGLIIYREATLIWDPKSGTGTSRQKVATVISHEIAHQVRLHFLELIVAFFGPSLFLKVPSISATLKVWQLDHCEI